MKNYADFIKLPDNEISAMLKKQKIFIPTKINRAQLLDFATSKLHGIEFIHNDEKLDNGKIVKKVTEAPKPKPGAECPNCKQKTLRKLKVLDTNQYAGYTHCSYCGLYLSSNEQKELTTPKEIKA